MTAEDITELDKNIIRVLQGDFPLVAEPYKTLAEQAGVVEIKLRGFYQSFQHIIGIWMEIEDDSQCFQNSQPVLNLLLIDIRV